MDCFAGISRAREHLRFLHLLIPSLKLLFRVALVFYLVWCQKCFFHKIEIATACSVIYSIPLKSVSALMCFLIFASSSGGPRSIIPQFSHVSFSLYGSNLPIFPTSNGESTQILHLLFRILPVKLGWGPTSSARLWKSTNLTCFLVSTIVALLKAGHPTKALFSGYGSELQSLS